MSTSRPPYVAVSSDYVALASPGQEDHVDWDPNHPAPARPTAFPPTKANPAQSQTQAWRRVWLVLGVALISLVGADLWRSLSSANLGQRVGLTSTSAVAEHRPYGYDPDERTVVIFIHHDTELANENTRFFIKHALHDRADFVFVLNGESELREEFPDHLPNVRVIQRDNTCYDLGAHGEVLKANDKELIKKYDKFILMNASVRGPFMPRWSNECWSNIFTSRVTDQVKLVGLTLSCVDGTDTTWVPEISSSSEGMDSTHKLRHIQAMLLATDKVGAALLLHPLGLDACHSDYAGAVRSEIHLSNLVWQAGYQVDALMNKWNDQDSYEERCADRDPYDEYAGGYLPIPEVLFSKVRKQPAEVVAKYSHWARDYSSYDHCPVY